VKKRRCQSRVCHQCEMFSGWKVCVRYLAEELIRFWGGRPSPGSIERQAELLERAERAMLPVAERSKVTASTRLVYAVKYLRKKQHEGDAQVN